MAVWLVTDISVFGKIYMMSINSIDIREYINCPLAWPAFLVLVQ
jgi:hypothetical protein